MNTVIKTIVLLILCLGGYQPLAVSVCAQNDKAQQYLDEANSLLAK